AAARIAAGASSFVKSRQVKFGESLRLSPAPAPITRPKGGLTVLLQVLLTSARRSCIYCRHHFSVNAHGAGNDLKSRPGNLHSKRDREYPELDAGVARSLREND